MEEEKKKGVVEKSGEGLGKVANKGAGVVKEEQLALLKERIKVAREDHELFIEKLKEVER